MAKIRNPYTYACKKRKDMVAHILDVGGHNDTYYRYPLAFNVKGYHADLSFDHLWATIWDQLPFHTEEYKTYLQKVYQEHEFRLFEIGVEDARRSMTEADCHNTLWSGETFEVIWDFIGSSGGWACPADWNGYHFQNVSDYDFEEMLEEMNWADLQKLYKMVVQWETDLTPQKASREIEYQAAFNLMANYADINWKPTPIHTMGKRKIRLKRSR